MVLVRLWETLRAFRSPVPGMGQKPINIFHIINHSILGLRGEVTALKLQSGQSEHWSSDLSAGAQ